MRTILAIALQAIRCAFRSRVFLSVLALVGITVVGMPLTVKGDGTTAGYIHVLLCYTLGLTAVLLAVATVWTAAASIAADIKTKRILLVATKPVHRIQVWIGKWVGLACLQLLLVAATGALVYGEIAWLVRMRGAGNENGATDHATQILSARRVVHPEQPTDAQATVVVAPGELHRWQFRLPRRPACDRLLLRCRRLAASDRTPHTLNGLWLIGPENSRARYRHREAAPSGVHEFSFPASAVPAGGVLTVEYANMAAAGTASVAFNGAGALEILFEDGSFEMNLVRALLVLGCYLAFLTAFGLLLGSVLSLPVAVFVSVSFLLLLGSHDYIAAVASQGVRYLAPHRAVDGTTITDYAVLGVFRLLNMVLRPFEKLNPLPLLADGRLVSWPLTLEAFVVLTLLGSALMALLSAWWFGKRELGLAG